MSEIQIMSFTPKEIQKIFDMHSKDAENNRRVTTRYFASAMAVATSGNNSGFSRFMSQLEPLQYSFMEEKKEPDEINSEDMKGMFDSLGIGAKNGG